MSSSMRSLTIERNDIVRDESNAGVVSVMKTHGG